MALSSDLMGLGTPPSVATRTGWRVVALTGVGTAQGGAPIVASAGENVIVNLTTAGGATACTLPSASAVGDTIWINVIASTTAVVFPPSGGIISNKAADAKVDVAVGAAFTKVSATLWASAGAA